MKTGRTKQHPRKDASVDAIIAARAGEGSRRQVIGEHLLAIQAGHSKSGKTMIFVILNKFDGNAVGTVSYLGRARGYVFDSPPRYTSYTPHCLLDIVAFCKQLTFQHRKGS